MTSRPRGSDDLQLEPPIAQHRDVVRAVEDRSFVAFIAGAMFIALAGGFVLAVVASLASIDVMFGERTPWLIQAHGWAQLQGWSGLFVAGMGLRLLPRFGGRKPLGRRTNLSIFALLFSGVLSRTLAQTFADGDLAGAGLLIGQLLWAAGATGFAITVGSMLWRGKGLGQPWHTFAAAGVMWWLTWAVAGVIAGVRGARNDAFVPAALDDAMTWMVMLGAIGNFIWAVQSRSVPVFFGRKIPTLRRIAVPAVLLNAGPMLILATGFVENDDAIVILTGAGFILAGAGLAWIAPLAGSCWGKPTRLRPRARAAARFVLFANLAAVACGLMLVWAGTKTLADGELSAFAFRDGARHAFGVGVITMLIVGMAQLVAPFFAMQRVEARGSWLFDTGTLWLLGGAAILRVASALGADQIETEARMHTSALSGVMAWLGLILFAAALARAIRTEPRIRASIDNMVTGKQPNS